MAPGSRGRRTGCSCWVRSRESTRVARLFWCLCLADSTSATPAVHRHSLELSTRYFLRRWAIWLRTIPKYADECAGCPYQRRSFSSNSLSESALPMGSPLKLLKDCVENKVTRVRLRGSGRLAIGKRLKENCAIESNPSKPYHWASNRFSKGDASARRVFLNSWFD